MVTLIIRDLDDALLIQLKKRAWYQGLPLEESLRRLVIESVGLEAEQIGEDILPSEAPNFGVDRPTPPNGVVFHVIDSDACVCGDVTGGRFNACDRRTAKQRPH